MEELWKRIDIIKGIWNNDTNFINEWTSEELFEIILTFVNNPQIRNLIERDAQSIIDRCSVDFDMLNYFTILSLLHNNIDKENCKKSLTHTTNSIFSKETLLYLMKVYKKIKEIGFSNSELLFNKIIEDLKEMPTDKSSKILFDLYIFPDFKLYLDKTHRVTATLIETYGIYNPDVISSQIFNGSTIIGKLIKDNNELIVAKYLRELLKEKQISARNIKMIGGGSTSLVYQIGNKVIKFGENRHSRRIYINHRILASLVRKLELDKNEKELFYVEIMRLAKTGDVTIEERDELKKDLYDQGLIWDDDKLENCGVLMEGDDNISDMPIDYTEIAGVINNPTRREEFMKRKRKVVVIDNDDIRYNTLRTSG